MNSYSEQLAPARLPGRGSFVLFLFAAILTSRVFADTLISTASFTYTGSVETFTVPAGADRVVIKTWGAGGGGGFYSSGAGGGFATATYSVTPGQVLYVLVAGRGEGSYTGGYNGGGSAGGGGAGGGGGGSQVYSSGGLNLWAGGGGGGGQMFGAGGAGGGTSGSAGGSGVPGAGGTQSAGGAGGANASAGSAGNGGAGAGTTGYPGGGGGGGYFGGGGGGDGVAGVGGAGGGGGSAGAAGSPVDSYLEAGSGIYPGGTGDGSYPGGGVGNGGDFGLYHPGYHGYVLIQAYVHTTMPTVASPGQITSAQNQSVSYTISASGLPSPSLFGASGLPTGLSVNTSNGVISGQTTTPGSYSTTISATNSVGTSSVSFTWTVTAATVTPDGAVSPGTIDLGSSVTLSRGGSANFGVAFTEGTVWKPNGQYDSLGVQALGSQTYTPNGGVGTYWWQYRVVDIYSNYTDQWIPFYVQTAATVTFSASATTVAFGQTVTFSSTSSDPDNNMSFHSIWWDQGSSLYWSNAQFNWSYPASGGYTISNSGGSCPSSGQTITGSFTPAAPGVYQFLGYGWDTFSGGSGLQIGITVTKATPNASFSNSSATGTHTVTSAELNAAFSNPYSGSVAVPTGSVTYSISGIGTIGAGTVLLPGTYTVTASYAGNANYNAKTVTATWTIANRDPSISVQILDASHNVIALNGAGRAPVLFGGQFYIRVNGNDPDENLSTLYSRLNDPNGNGVDYPQVTVSGGSASHDFGPYSANQLGIWNMWAHVQDGNSVGYSWQGNGWWGTESPDVEVYNTPPTVRALISATTINFGQSLTLTTEGNDIDGNLATVTGWVRGPNSTPYVAPDWTGWTNILWTNFSATTNRSQTVGFTPTGAGIWQYHANALDTVSAWASGDINHFVSWNTWANTSNVVAATFTVNRTTPTSSFSSKSWTGAHVVTAADLNAAFANPYSSSVAAPGGTVTYRFAGTTTAITVGTSLPYGTSSIEAVYPGDANYSATTVTAAFTATGVTTPASFQATTTGSSLVAFSWSASSSAAGINHYDIYRGATFAGSSTSTTFQDNGASPNTTYTYTVTAVDNGSHSSTAASVSVTTLASFELFTPTP